MHPQVLSYSWRAVGLPSYLTLDWTARASETVAAEQGFEEGLAGLPTNLHGVDHSTEVGGFGAIFALETPQGVVPLTSGELLYACSGLCSETWMWARI